MLLQHQNKLTVPHFNSNPGSHPGPRWRTQTSYIQRFSISHRPGAYCNKTFIPFHSHCLLSTDSLLIPFSALKLPVRDFWVPLKSDFVLTLYLTIFQGRHDSHRSQQQPGGVISTQRYTLSPVTRQEGHTAAADTSHVNDTTDVLNARVTLFAALTCYQHSSSCSCTRLSVKFMDIHGRNHPLSPQRVVWAMNMHNFGKHLGGLCNTSRVRYMS